MAMAEGTQSDFETPNRGEDEFSPGAGTMTEESPSDQQESRAADSTSPFSLPGYLPWEQDMEMVSKYLDRKVRWAL